MSSSEARNEPSNGRLDIEDAAALVAYLRSTGRIKPDEHPTCRPLWGGVSNRTVLVMRERGDSWVLKQSLARLRVPVEWYSDRHRAHQEALGMEWLARHLPPGSVPTLVFEDPEHHLIAMEAVPPPNPTWKQLLLKGDLVEDHVVQFGEMLALIHRKSGRLHPSLPSQFNDRSHFESLRLEPFYRYTGTMTPKAAAFLDDLVKSALRHRWTLVHGDYSPKNVLIHDGRLILLDHEIIHFGDPAFDIGFSMTHLLCKGHHLEAMRDRFAAAAVQYWNTYRAQVEDEPWFEGLEPRAVRHTLGCLAARAAGRSKLEYLDEAARAGQIELTCTLMAEAPSGLTQLIDRFLREI